MKETIACRKAFSQTLLELAREDRDLYAVTSDARGSVTLNDFAKQLPDQLIECGIAEQNEIGVAAGMALAGKKVFVCAPAPFLSARGYEQLKLDVAYNRANVKVCGVSGGVSYGTLGTSHHALQDIASTRSLEGLTVLIPSDGAQTRWLTRWMARTEGPVYMRMGRNPVPGLYGPDTEFQVGKAMELKAGQDLSILAAGETVSIALEAARLLEARGISARILDLFSIKPLDTEAILKAARETWAILTVEEHCVYGGLGGMVAEVVSQSYPVPMTIMGLPDEHTYPGESPDVFRHYNLTPEGIAKQAQELFGKKQRQIAVMAKFFQQQEKRLTRITED
ncbi:MAG: transketolase family protein [Oscillospiraceae bacterium]|nr:transketolase family protein [Oscillospiraceae bacterium]